MNKADYIVKTLSRTKRKDYENYVINRLYNELNDFEIKPVSQQYVKREHGKYALIDLYFPQLNIGIEVDEIHHSKQVEADQLRFYDIVTAIGNYEEIRINTFENNDKKSLRDLTLINQDISKAVEKIKIKKKEIKGFIPWDGVPDINRALEKNLIRVSDNFVFSQEEVRKFFGRTGITRLAYYKLSEGKYLWLPGLAVEDNGYYIPYNKNLNFVNIISNDGKQILEVLPTVHDFSNEDNVRVVFLKMNDPILNKQVYKFAGVFKRRNHTTLKEINGKAETCVIHDLIAEEISQ